MRNLSDFYTQDQIDILTEAPKDVTINFFMVLPDRAEMALNIRSKQGGYSEITSSAFSYLSFETLLELKKGILERISHRPAEALLEHEMTN